MPPYQNPSHGGFEIKWLSCVKPYSLASWLLNSQLKSFEGKGDIAVDVKVYSEKMQSTLIYVFTFTHVSMLNGFVQLVTLT
jgi:hypothetical protein